MVLFLSVLTNHRFVLAILKWHNVSWFINNNTTCISSWELGDLETYLLAIGKPNGRCQCSTVHNTRMSNACFVDNCPVVDSFPVSHVFICDTYKYPWYRPTPYQRWCCHIYSTFSLSHYCLRLSVPFKQRPHIVPCRGSHTRKHMYVVTVQWNSC